MEKNFNVINSGVTNATATEMPKKIKTSEDKFKRILRYYGMPEESKNLEASVIDDSNVVKNDVSFEQPKIVEEPKAILDSSVLTAVPTFETFRSEPVKEESVVELVPEKVEEPITQPYSEPVKEVKPYSTSYSSFELKSVSNSINMDNMITKLKAEAERADSTTFYGKVVFNGIKKIEAIEKEKEDLKFRINQLGVSIKDLEEEINIAQNNDMGIEVLLRAYKQIDQAKQNLDKENKLQQTSNIDLNEIEKALEKTKRSEKELEEVKTKSNEEINDKKNSISSMKDEQRELSLQLQEKDKELFSVCRTIDEDKQRANEYMKRSAELEMIKQKHDNEEEKLKSNLDELFSSISLVEEEPKKPVEITNFVDDDSSSIKNPFDKMREIQNEVKPVSISNR